MIFLPLKKIYNHTNFFFWPNVIKLRTKFSNKLSGRLSLQLHLISGAEGRGGEGGAPAPPELSNFFNYIP